MKRLQYALNAVEISTDILVCRIRKEFQDEMQDDVHLQGLENYIINGWPSMRAESGMT